MNSVPHSAGIVLSIWQATVPKLIPTEFRELTGFRQESVEDSKDLACECVERVDYMRVLGDLKEQWSNLKT